MAPRSSSKPVKGQKICATCRQRWICLLACCAEVHTMVLRSEYRYELRSLNSISRISAGQTR